jgi:uncharacterized protein (DUF1330 family)
MKTGVRNTLIGLLGAAFGAATVTALWAQTSPPTYIVIDIGEITDAAAWGAVVANAPNPPSGYLVRTQKAVQLDGATAPARFVVIPFDSEAKAKEWFNSPAVAAVNAVRLKVTKSRAFLVEGTPK